MPVILPQVKSLLVHRTVGPMLAYLNCHAYIALEAIFTLSGRFAPGSNLLVYL